MSITFSSNIPLVEAKFEQWERKFRNKKNTILKPFAEKEVDRVKRRIQVTKQDPDGKPWEFWSRSTEEARVRKGTASKGLLYDSGDLFNSIHYDIQNDTFAIGSGLDYAEYLQEGTQDMPAREFLGFNERSESDIQWLIETIFKT